MNWDAAIELNRIALQRLLGVMIAAAGIEAGGSVAFVPRHVRLMILRLLGPAESAYRRLVLLKARNMPDVEHVRRAPPEKTISRGKGGTGKRAFPLFDQRKKRNSTGKKRPAGTGPRIYAFDETDAYYAPDPQKPAPEPDDLVCAQSLCKRLESLRDALGDISRQARRLKRAQARRAVSKRQKLQGPLRINTPPHHRERGSSVYEREVDAVLAECQTLARRWLALQDSS